MSCLHIHATCCLMGTKINWNRHLINTWEKIGQFENGEWEGNLAIWQCGKTLEDLKRETLASYRWQNYHIVSLVGSYLPD